GPCTLPPPPPPPPPPSASPLPTVVKPARTSTNIGYGSGNWAWTVKSSILTNLPGLPLIENSGAGVGVSSLFEYRSSYQNIRSSAVNGWPSDHFRPLRKIGRAHV